MRHVTPLLALRSPGKPVNFSSAKHPRISAASNLFPRKNILLVCLVSEKSSRFFPREKKISIFFFPFSFLPPRRELFSTRTQTQYVISRKLKNETYVVSNVNAFHGHVRSLESNLRPHRCYIIPMKARAFKSTISISFIGDLSISLHLSN